MEKICGISAARTLMHARLASVAMHLIDVIKNRECAECDGNTGWEWGQHEFFFPAVMDSNKVGALFVRACALKTSFDLRLCTTLHVHFVNLP